jgi:hypothetical protein
VDVSPKVRLIGLSVKNLEEKEEIIAERTPLKILFQEFWVRLN